MQFIDLKTQQGLIRQDLESRLGRIFDHGQFILGPEVTEMEQRLARYVGVRHCVSVASGTDALLLALMALGIGAGDEVITTPFSFIATAEVVALLGAVPVFVDVDSRTYNLDPRCVEQAIGPRTQAILPVDLYGQCADMAAINDIACRHGLPVVEDAAQSFGATYRGQHSCSLATIGCTSFFPTKPLGCYGDGGACFTDDAELAARLIELRNHGQDRRYHHTRLGLNGRMDTIQAAVILAKLAILADEVEARARIGARYSAELAGAACVTPYLAPDHTSVYAQYTLQVADRAALQAALQREGIPSAVHYPTTLERQPALASRSRCVGKLTVARALAERVVSLPMHPYLDAADQDRVVTAVRRFC